MQKRTITTTTIDIEPKHPGSISPLPFDAAEVAAQLAACYRILSGELPVDDEQPRRRLRIRVRRDGLQSRQPRR